MGADGFRAATASQGVMESTQEVGAYLRETEQTENTARATHRSWNVYLEWNEPGCSGSQIFREIGTTEHPKISPTFGMGFCGVIESDVRYTLLNEGKPPFPEADQKEASEPQRDWRGIGRDTAFYMAYQVVVAGFLYLLPESVTGWTDDQKKTTVKKWKENVQNPAWDKDKWWINYLAHPYWGATFYIRARERGFGEFGSFGYSALLSALFEFGIEAFFEPPSYQDLIVTPVGGYFVGKFVFEPIRENIKAKTQLAWYDHAGLILTDPLGAVNSVFERALGIQSDIRVQFHSPPRNHMAAVPPAERSLEWQEVKFCRPDGMRIELQVEWK